MLQRSSTRLTGVDVARGVALLGMVAVHVLPRDGADGGGSALVSLASGRSAATFAVLAGVGLALSSRRWDVRGRLALVLRAALIGVVGLGLAAADSGVAVILAYYAVLFVLAQPFLDLPARPLLALSAAVAVVLPVVSFAVRDDLPARDPANPGLERLADPGPLVSELLLTGYYPALVWLAYLLLGLGVGRLALQRAGVAAGLAGTGAVLVAAAAGLSAYAVGRDDARAALSDSLDLRSTEQLDAALSGSQYGNVPTDTPWWLAVDSPHSSTSLDLLGTGGAALLVLGTALLVAGRLPPRVAVLLSPLAAAGSMPLTLYSAHVLLLGLTGTDDPGRYYLLQVTAGLAFAVLWRRRVGRGPLEGLLGLLTRPVAGAARRSAVRT